MATGSASRTVCWGSRTQKWVIGSSNPKMGLEGRGGVRSKGEGLGGVGCGQGVGELAALWREGWGMKGGE